MTVSIRCIDEITVVEIDRPQHRNAVDSETAIFGIFCRRFGVPLIDLGTVRLPRLIGHSRAMDLILTGREDRLSAIEQWGFEENAAMRNEMRRGLATIDSGEAAAGAASFAHGTGRHGGERN